MTYQISLEPRHGKTFYKTPEKKNKLGGIK